mmetsp:Transcript_41859/g.58460  ORF Transcript_41859/g.58460 Transcript_41859/m.58460 type:complete len:94 (+) Transcript_41859:539-820(+)
MATSSQNTSSSSQNTSSERNSQSQDIWPFSLFCQMLLSFFSMSTLDIGNPFNFGLHSKTFIICHCHLNNRTTTTKITNQTILNRKITTTKLST